MIFVQIDLDGNIWKDMTWMPRYQISDLDAKENLLDSDSWAPVLLLIQDGQADLQNDIHVICNSECSMAIYAVQASWDNVKQTKLTVPLG